MTTKPTSHDFQVSLPLFEGPFTLLPILVKKQELNIQQLSLLQLIDQFLHHLNKRREIQFLHPADMGLLPHITWLHNCKSNTLVQTYQREGAPHEEEEEEGYDPTYCLDCLKEYSTIRTYTSNLHSLEETETHSSYRPADSLEEEAVRPTDTCSIDDLKDALFRLLAERKEEKYLIEKEPFTLQQASQELLLLLKHGPLSFSELCLRSDLSRKKLIVFFLAILELLKQGDIFLTKQTSDILLHGHT